jgi:hypothetical protein
MSLRPEIFAFRLEPLRALFGSGSTDAITAIHQKLQELAGEDADDEDIAEELNLAKSIVSRAIMEGTPFPELDAEADAHVTAANHLASHGQKWKGTGSNGWKMGAFWELDEKTRGQWKNPKAEEIFQYFIKGRPLFGKQIDTGWSYYSYASLDEVVLLKSELEAFREISPRFIDEFRQWLNVAASDHLDLWMYTY